MRQKIDIADVEAATKIRAKYLRALENEEFGLLPGPDVRQDVPAHLRRVPGARRPAARRGVPRPARAARRGVRPDRGTRSPRRPRRGGGGVGGGRGGGPRIGPPGPGAVFGDLSCCCSPVILVLGLTADEEEPGGGRRRPDRAGARRGPVGRERPGAAGGQAPGGRSQATARGTALRPAAARAGGAGLRLRRRRQRGAAVRRHPQRGGDLPGRRITHQPGPHVGAGDDQRRSGSGSRRARTRSATTCAPGASPAAAARPAPQLLMARRAGIVVTGTEVLTGRVQDRNGPWLADRLLRAAASTSPTR